MVVVAVLFVTVSSFLRVT